MTSTKQKNLKTHLPHVDASGLLALQMLVPQLSDRPDGIQARVLGQRERDDLHRLGEGAEAVLLHASQLVRNLRQLHRYLDFGSTAASDQRSAEEQTNPQVLLQSIFQ